MLTTTEAASLVKRSTSTIKRWANKALETDPAAKKLIFRKKTPSGYKYDIDKNYLLQHFKEDIDLKDGTDSNTETKHPKSDIAFLRSQIETKDQQIKMRDELINNLSQIILNMQKK